MIKISFPKRKFTMANYTSYSKLQEKATSAKQAAENANATKNNNSQAKDIVATIKSFEQYTNRLFRINHSFPTFDCVCYLNESISDDERVEKGPCTFQLTVGASHSNNMTWDSYNLLDSLYKSSNQRKIKHFIVVLRSNIEKFTYKNSFETNDLKLIEHLFEMDNTEDKDNTNEIISRAKKVIDEADKNSPDFKNVTSAANKTIFETKKLVADKALSKILEKCVDQYCLQIN